MKCITSYASNKSESLSLEKTFGRLTGIGQSLFEDGTVLIFVVQRICEISV
jgi:hypothetical protein